MRFSFLRVVTSATKSTVDAQTGEITHGAKAITESISPVSNAHYAELCATCASFNAFSTEKGDLLNEVTLAAFAKRGFAPYGGVKIDSKKNEYRTFIATVTEY